jgi:hypothetical protein
MRAQWFVADSAHDALLLSPLLRCHCLTLTLYPQLMPVLLDACGSSHSDLRQCAVYGVGLGASLAPEAFKPHAAAALAAVQAMLTAPVS